MKKGILAVVIANLILFVCGGDNWAFCDPDLKLPENSVQATHQIPGTVYDAFFDITISGIIGEYDVQNGVYPGWCSEDNFKPNSSFVTLFSSYDLVALPADSQIYTAPLPPHLQGLEGEPIPWDKLNYLLNHKQGEMRDIQAAIWLLLWGKSDSYPITDKALAMYNDANTNGAGFCPEPGEIVAVILYVDGIHPEEYQDSIIEVIVPPEDIEGCTPGYWKQYHHFDSWEYYMPIDKFSDVFDRVIKIKLKKVKIKGKKKKRKIVYKEDPTLKQALEAKGGKINALARHAVAALLNAASPDVDYEYSEFEVIQMFKDAYDSGDYEPTKDMFEMANESFCPLD